MILYKLLRFFGLPLYRLLYPRKILGRENLPEKENFILVSNHFSMMDVVVVSELFKKRPYMLGKKELMKHKLIGKLLLSYGLIPIDRKSVDIEALKKCFSVLKEGSSLVIFPEGTRNKTDEELHEIKGGASVIACKAKVPIVPVAMRSKFRVFGKNVLAVGKPLEFTGYYGKRLDAETVKELDEAVFGAIESCREETLKIGVKAPKGDKAGK